MKTIMKSYEDFCRMLQVAKVYRNPFVTFRDICRVLGVAPDDLNEIILEDTGYTGDELMSIYRKEK